jgi:predicted transposase YbfD/YdcC
MKIFEELQKEMQEIEAQSNHEGYWYSIRDVLTLMICGMLCGLQRIDDIHDWAKSSPTRKFLRKEFGIKRILCRAQFYNILRCVDAEKFKLSFTRWMKKILSGNIAGKTVAIDGKTVCGTEKLTEDGSVLHIASALVSEFNLVIGSHECDTKTGEITAFRELIGLLDISGTVVVADALHCNQNSAKAVVEAGADYLFVVKDNIPTLKEEIELYIQNEVVPSHQTTEKNGGRIEKRTAFACNDIEWMSEKEKLPHIVCIGAIHREFENIKHGHKSSEWHYYVSSAVLSPEELLTRARLEWGIESMHWLLDVHFGEDKTRVWDMNVQNLLNITRKISLNMIRLFRDANCSARTPFTSVLKGNLFDLDQLSRFLRFFKKDLKLD